MVQLDFNKKRTDGGSTAQTERTDGGSSAQPERTDGGSSAQAARTDVDPAQAARTGKQNFSDVLNNDTEG